MERAYAVAGLAVGLAIILISVDLLTGGSLSRMVSGALPAAAPDGDGAVS
jgi:hypothetical protein